MPPQRPSHVATPLCAASHARVSLSPCSPSSPAACAPQDPRVIQKLHRRVFLDKITRDEATLYLSFYVEAANRDAFMASACRVCV